MAGPGQVAGKLPDAVEQFFHLLDEARRRDQEFGYRSTVQFAVDAQRAEKTIRYYFAANPKTGRRQLPQTESDLDAVLLTMRQWSHMPNMAAEEARQRIEEAWKLAKADLKVSAGTTPVPPGELSAEAPPRAAPSAEEHATGDEIPPNLPACPPEPPRHDGQAGSQPQPMWSNPTLGERTTTGLLEALRAAVTRQSREEAIQSAAVLTRRHEHLGELLGGLPIPQAAAALAWIPSGAIRLPNGLTARVSRPVAIMARPISCSEMGMEAPLGCNASNVMATGVSMRDAQCLAQGLPAPLPFHWRLPRLAEWWMAMTAGTGVMPYVTYQGGLWLSDILPNPWRVRPPPPDAMEWVADDARLEGTAVSAQGEFRPVRGDVRPERTGFRLVLDWSDETGGAP